MPGILRHSGKSLLETLGQIFVLNTNSCDILNLTDKYELDPARKLTVAVQ